MLTEKSSPCEVKFVEVIEIPIDKLTPYSNNAKKHPKKQITQIANSIEEFGMNDPIGIWGDNNTIVEGHGRVLALKELGYKTVPCIRLDHLTEEQRKAYTHAHNKVAESEWDFSILDTEFDDITIDMTQFGFEFVDIEEEHEKNKANTQGRVANILNLSKWNVNGVGKYDIPVIEPIQADEIGEIKEWIGFNYVLSDTEPAGKAVHFFIDDYQFERLWNNPDKYVEKLKQYEAVLTPDFSPYMDMPMATQIFNHFRKHWIGSYLQAAGVKVIPTIRASRDERSLEWYLDGEPKGGVVAISSMWTSEEDDEEYFVKEEFGRMKKELSPEKIFVYGAKIKGLKGNIEYIPTFARKRFGE